MSEQKIIDLTHSPTKPAKKAKVTPRKRTEASTVQAPPPKRARSDSSSASSARPAWPKSKGWSSVCELAREVGVQFVVGVDPGDVNLGIVRMQLYPEFQITHWKILNLHEMCREMCALERMHMTPRNTAQGARFNTRAVLATLTHFVGEQRHEGGLFDAQLVVIESQDFARDKAAVQGALIGAFGVNRPPIVVHDGEGGRVPSVRAVSANSCKAWYGGFFPAESASVANAARGIYTDGFFGFGDVRRKGVNYDSNKLNVSRWGTYIAPLDAIRRHMGGRLTPADDRSMREHIARRKTDDVYDALFIALYAIGCIVYDLARRSRLKSPAPVDGTKAPSMRASRKFEELHEFMRVVQTPDATVAMAQRALFVDA